MEVLLSQFKARRTVKTFSMNLIVIAFFGLLFGISGLIVYLRSNTNFEHIHPDSLAQFFNPRLYIYQSAVQVVFSIFMMVGAFYLRVYSEKWRKIMIYILFGTALFLIIAPIISVNYIPNADTNLQIWGVSKTRIVIWSFLFSYCIACFFILVAVTLSRADVKRVFINIS